MICQNFALIFASLFLIIIFLQNQGSPYSSMNSKISDRCWQKNQTLKPNVLESMSSQQVIESGGVKDFVIYLRGGNKLKEACRQKSFSNYRQGLLYYSVPFLVLSVQTFLMLTFGMIFCIFDSKCPPCKMCKRDLLQEPFTKEEISYPLCMAITMAVFTIGAVIFGCIKSSGIVSGFQNSKCDSESIFEKLIYGSHSQNWIGLQDSSQSIQDMEIQTRSATNEMNSLLSLSSDIPWEFDQIYNLIQQFSDRHSSKYIPSSPDLEAKYNQTISQFLSLNFGRPSLSGTSTNQIVTALDESINPSYQAIQDVNQTFITLLHKEKNMQKVFLNASNILGSTAQQSLIFLEAMENFFHEISAYLKGFGANYLLFFSFCGSGSIITIFGGFTMNEKKPHMRYFMHLGWIIQCLLLTIVFTILCVAAPTIVVLVDLSVSFKDIASSRSMMQQYNYFFPQNLTYMMDICLFEQGDVKGNLNLTEQFNYLEEFFLTLDLLNKFDTQKNLQNLSKALNAQLILYKKYQGGYFPDSPYQDQRNQQISLNTFNQLTNFQTQSSNQSNCNLSRDQYVFDSINCTGSYVMQGNQSYNYRFGDRLCIPLRSMTEAKVRYRYQNISQKCPDVNESQLALNFQRLSKYDEQRRIVFQNIIDDFENLSRAMLFYQQKLSRLQDQLLNFSVHYSHLRSLVDKNHGIQSKMNCGFLKNEFSNLKNSFGVLFVTPLFFMTISLLVIAFTQLCSSYNTYKGVTRFSRIINLPLGDIKNKIYPIDLEDMEGKDQSELEKTFETRKGVISQRKFRKAGSFRSISSK